MKGIDFLSFNTGENWPSIEREVKDGILFYKEECEFLAEPQTWTFIYMDQSVTRKRNLYATRGHLFFQQPCDPDAVADGFFQLLCKVPEMKLKRSKFEEVLGIKIDKYGQEDLIYYASTEGIGLDKITSRTPRSVNRSIERILARAIREMHEKKIVYWEPVPTNFKYAFGDKIIGDPHSSLLLLEKELSSDYITRDLAIIFYTHKYIRNLESFLYTYFEEARTKIDLKKYERQIKNWMLKIEDDEDDGLRPADCWVRKNPYLDNRIQRI